MALDKTAHAPPLVLAAARKLEMAELAPFVESLRSFYDGDVAILASRISRRTRSYLAARGIELVPFRFFKPLHGPIHTARFRGFARFLESRPGMYGQVLVTDMRDVVFQADPFLECAEAGIDAFLEPPVFYGSSPLHDAWNDRFLTAGERMTLRGLPISCCGTLMGDSESIQRYCADLIARVDRLQVFNRHKLGADTAFHNLMIHDGSRRCRIHPNDAHVATMGISAPDGYGMGPGGTIMTASGSVPAICHQYDRFPQIAASIREKFAPDSSGKHGDGSLEFGRRPAKSPAAR